MRCAFSSMRSIRGARRSCSLRRQGMGLAPPRKARAVGPGGTFLLVGRDAANLKHGYGGPQQPDMFYTSEQVVAALGGELEIETASRVERPVETGNGARVPMDCPVRAARP
jgi:hypothetical protein